MRHVPLLFLSLCCSLVLSTPSEAGPPKEKERADKLKFSGDFDALGGPPMAPAPSMGATPGGAQDVAYFRDRVADGELPLPQTFTPEGLFSEHDLPVSTTGGCQLTFCVETESMPVSLLVANDVEFLGQLGFSSGLDPKTFKRAPLNLVAVVDRSGSMDGAPLELVRASLREVVGQLGPDDQISIVGYESTAHVMLRPTQIQDRKAILRAIDDLVSGGATAMEDGLEVGFELAERSAKKFQGSTRVMLFTDERPNVGRSDAGSFMAMARAASKRGVGLTTIGVSTHFGAELAQQISSVRGGNLFFFPDAHAMRDKFADEFDTMVTELAYELELAVAPAPGLKITGVYGVPGTALEWRDDTIVLNVETIFLSRRKGAIYVGLSRDGNANLPQQQLAPGDVIGQVQLRYEDAGDGKTRKTQAAFALVDRSAAGLGLTRGELLVDEATTLRRAMQLHHETNDQEGAYQLVRALHGRLRQAQDPELASERELVARLEDTLAQASGHAGESGPDAVKIDAITGLPPR